MRTEKELKSRLCQYDGVKYLYNDTGYIAWQVSTGENVEIMFIEVVETRKGHATALMKELVKRIKPFNSVFVFRLASNEDAGYFYRSLGFEETLIKGLYKGVDAVLGVVNYNTVCQNLSIK